MARPPQRSLCAATPFVHPVHARGEDITLVVQKPDGSYVCDDDTEDLNPVVTMPNFPAGNYKIWVGSYSMEDGGAAYRLGFSTDPAAMPSQLQQ